MTTANLGEILQNYLLDLCVVVSDYENDYDDLSTQQLSVIRTALNTGKHPWDGRHGGPNGWAGVGPDCADVIKALVLRWVSN